MTLLNQNTMSRLASLELRARYVVEGLLSGLHASPWRGHSLEFAQHREYAYGDELRHIDWKVFGRSDRFFIKQFQDETNLRAHILLDASGSMGFSAGGRATKLDYAKQVCAALAYLLLHQEDACGVGIFDTSLKVVIPPHHQLSHLARLCAALEGAAGGGETAIAPALKEFGRHLKRRSLVILASDLMDEPEKILSALKMFRFRHHEVIVLQVLDPAELSFPYEGENVFEQMEGKGSLHADADMLSAEYRRLFTRFIGSYQSGFRQAGIDFHCLMTDVPLEKALIRLLERRS